MAIKTTYDRALLDHIIARDGATLVGTYEKLNRESVITFKCKCGNEFSKTFRRCYENQGCYCKGCGNEISVNKRRIIFMEKYGVDNPNKSSVIRNKIIETNLNKYGYNTNLQDPHTKQQIKETCIKLYGFEYAAKSPEIKLKNIETCERRYGVQFPVQINGIKDKIKQTCKEKYGVEYPAQNQEVFEKAQKNAKRLKDFTMPSGTIRKVQGYEPFALRDLLGNGLNEEQIKTGRTEIPRIKYKTEEKDRYYFPDIFIPHENRIIEVKSTWTYKCKTDFVIQKGEAAKAAGYNYECWIYNSKGERVECEEEGNIIINP